MPFVNESSERELNANAPRHEPVESSSFGDVFGASLGQVFDEELSVSSLLNREGFSQREQAVKESADAGDINLNDYSKRGIIDYNRIASDHADLNIKTNEQLHQERNDLLAQRRNYAEDVIERGSGTAQFLGAATGYMLDPVNVLSMGIAVPYTASKAVSVIGRAALAGKNAAVITGATELGIQALVFQHKQSIDSPYGAGDALANIAMAATGAAALGATAGGLSAWIESVLKVADDLPQTKDVTASKQYLARFKDNLKDAPEADTPEAQIQSDVDHLAEMDRRAEQYSAPSKTPDQYAEPEGPVIPAGEAANKKKLESDRLQRAKKQGFDVDRTYYHGTRADFDTFEAQSSGDLGFHFGTKEQANSRLEDMRGVGDRTTQGENIIPVHLRPGKSLQVSDHEFFSVEFANDGDDTFLRELIGGGIPAKSGMDSAELSKVIKNSGYDSLVYKNIYEGDGNSDSIIILDPENIRSTNSTFSDKSISKKSRIDNNVSSSGSDLQAEAQQGPQTSPRELDIVQRQGLAQAYEDDLKAFNTIDNPTVFVDGEAVDAKALIKNLTTN